MYKLYPHFFIVHFPQSHKKKTAVNFRGLVISYVSGYVCHLVLCHTLRRKCQLRGVITGAAWLSWLKSVSDKIHRSRNRLAGSSHSDVHRGSRSQGLTLTVYILQTKHPGNRGVSMYEWKTEHQVQQQFVFTGFIITPPAVTEETNSVFKKIVFLLFYFSKSLYKRCS